MMLPPLPLLSRRGGFVSNAAPQQQTTTAHTHQQLQRNCSPPPLPGGNSLGCSKTPEFTRTHRIWSWCLRVARPKKSCSKPEGKLFFLVFAFWFSRVKFRTTLLVGSVFFVVRSFSTHSFLSLCCRVTNWKLLLFCRENTLTDDFSCVSCNTVGHSRVGSITKPNIFRKIPHRLPTQFRQSKNFTVSRFRIWLLLSVKRYKEPTQKKLARSVTASLSSGRTQLSCTNEQIMIISGWPSAIVQISDFPHSSIFHSHHSNTLLFLRQKQKQPAKVIRLPS